MIKITKDERNKLVNMGCKEYVPKDSFRDICRTYGHYTSYYLRETDNNIQMLKIIRGEN